MNMREAFCYGVYGFMVLTGFGCTCLAFVGILGGLAKLLTFFFGTDDDECDDDEEE